MIQTFTIVMHRFRLPDLREKKSTKRVSGKLSHSPFLKKASEQTAIDSRSADSGVKYFVRSLNIQVWGAKIDLELGFQTCAMIEGPISGTECETTSQLTIFEL